MSVGYDELQAHLGTCKFVWSEAPKRTDRLTERLATKVRQLEQRLKRRDANAEQADTESADRRGEDGTNRRTHRLR